MWITWHNRMFTKTAKNGIHPGANRWRWSCRKRILVWFANFHMVRSVKSKTRKYSYIFAILLLAGIVMYVTDSFTSWTYEPFKPVYLAKDKLVASDEDISDKLHHNIIQVLTFYKVSFKLREDGTIMIPGSLARDKDTLWNYTSKANDDEWLKTHI